MELGGGIHDVTLKSSVCSDLVGKSLGSVTCNLTLNSRVDQKQIRNMVCSGKSNFQSFRKLPDFRNHL